MGTGEECLGGAWRHGVEMNSSFDWPISSPRCAVSVDTANAD